MSTTRRAGWALPSSGWRNEDFARGIASARVDEVVRGLVTPAELAQGASPPAATVPHLQSPRVSLAVLSLNRRSRLVHNPSPGLARHLAAVDTTEDPAAPAYFLQRGAIVHMTGGPALRRLLIAQGVLRPADGIDRHGETITAGKPYLALDAAGVRAVSKPHERGVFDPRQPRPKGPRRASSPEVST